MNRKVFDKDLPISGGGSLTPEQRITQEALTYLIENLDGTWVLDNNKIAINTPSLAIIQKAEELLKEKNGEQTTKNTVTRRNAIKKILFGLGLATAGISGATYAYNNYSQPSDDSSLSVDKKDPLKPADQVGGITLTDDEGNTASLEDVTPTTENPQAMDSPEQGTELKILDSGDYPFSQKELDLGKPLTDEELQKIGAELQKDIVGTGTLTRLVNINNFEKNPEKFDDLSEENKYDMLKQAYKQLYTVLAKPGISNAETFLKDAVIAIFKLDKLGVSKNNEQVKEYQPLLNGAIYVLTTTYGLTATATEKAYVSTNATEKTASKSPDGLTESQRKNYREINTWLVAKGLDKGKIDKNYLKKLKKVDSYLKALDRGIKFGNYGKIEKEVLTLLRNELKEIEKSEKKQKNSISLNDDDLGIDLD